MVCWQRPMGSARDAVGAVSGWGAPPFHRSLLQIEAHSNAGGPGGLAACMHAGSKSAEQSDLTLHSTPPLVQPLDQPYFVAPIITMPISDAPISMSNADARIPSVSALRRTVAAPQSHAARRTWTQRTAGGSHVLLSLGLGRGSAEARYLWRPFTILPARHKGNSHPLLARSADRQTGSCFDDSSLELPS